jgi:hypothetical protein
MTSDRLTTPEAAALLGLAPGSMRQLAKAGVLHPERPSPRVLVFDRAEVERYARERRPRGRPRKEGG